MGKIEYAELARKLWPFMAGYVGQYSGGNSVLTAAAAGTSTGGSAPSYASFLTLGTDADLSAERVFTVGAGLSGTDAGAGSTYTLALGTPSSITVGTGNLATGSTHYHSITTSSNPGAAASILASDSSGFLSLVKLRTPTIDTSSGALTLSPATDVVLTPASNLVKLSSNVALQSSNFASQTTGVRINYAGEGDFRYLFTDELHAKSFIADLEQALAGGQIIAKSVAALYSNFSMPNSGSSATFIVRDLPSATGMAVFENRDIVRFRAFSRSAGSLTITDAWGEVTLDTSYGTSGFDSATKTQRYTYLRRTGITIDDTTNDPITDTTSDPILSSNVSTPEGAMGGSTIIYADSIVLDYGKNQSGIHEINAIDGLYGLNSPYAQTVSWSIHPKNATVRTRLGNLRGIFSVADEYGLYAGTGTASTDQYLRMSTQGVLLNNVTLQLVGTGTVTGSSAGIFGLDASSKPTFSLVNSVSTVNGEDMTAGDAMFGDNTSSKGNTFFDQSAGTLNIRTGTTNVLSFSSAGMIEGVLNLGTDGGIWQGSSGSFSSPTTGLKIYRSSNEGTIETWKDSVICASMTPDYAFAIQAGTDFSSTRALNFVDSGGTQVGEVYGYKTSTAMATAVRARANDSARTAFLYNSALQQSSTGKAYLYNWASKYDGSTSFSTPWALIKQEVDINANSARIYMETSSTSGTATLELKAVGATLTWAATGVSKSWRIDHPLKPTTHWLDHATVEGPGNYTFYRGNATLNDDGKAVVQMPDWFDALNDDMSIVYGAWSEGVTPHTIERIENGWVVAGAPNQKVSWIASGLRADAWAKHHHLRVETEKDADDHGYIAAWQEHGLDESYAKPMQSNQASPSIDG